MVSIDMDILDRKLKMVYSELRLKNFKINLPFLILSEKLPQGQSYREFSDGHIEIQKIYSVGSELKSKHIRTLTQEEAEKVRLESGLL
jgi:hypothetical protein